MSDVKRFTGFIAIDGSTHATEKAAVTHTRDVKTAAALEKLRALVVEGAPGATSFEGIAYIESEGMPIFLAANREAILEAVRDLALQQLAADFLVSEQEAPNEMEKVRAACRTLIQFGVRYPRLYMLIYEHTDGGRPDYKTIFNTFHFRYMRDKLKLLERAGLLNMPEGFTVELLILQLWTCIHGILAMRQNLMADEPIFRKVSERLVDQMLANLEYPQDQWQISPSEMES